MPNLFRTGGGSENCSYSVSYNTPWGYDQNGNRNFRSTSQYPIFNNKNIEIICEYSVSSYTYLTVLKLLDESKNTIKKYESSNQKVSFKIDLTAYPNAKYFNLETGTNFKAVPGHDKGETGITIKVY